MSDNNEAAPKVDSSETWAIVELMGHVRLAGRISEVEKFGCKMGRLDIPTADGFVTQFFGGSSIYRITPVTEQVARAAAKECSPAPVQPWDYPKRLTAAQTCKDCIAVAEPDCDNGRCADHCNERCDTHCERAIERIHDADEFNQER